MPPFPNDLFDRGREVLARYGYSPDGGALDWAAEWQRLRPDFPGRVPQWPALSEPQRRAAAEYLALRLAADRHLEHCEALHAELLAAGIATDPVERYAAARELYEDAVEAFGVARRRLQDALECIGST